MSERPAFSHGGLREVQAAMKVLIADECPLMREALVNVLAALGPRVDALQADSLGAALAELEAHPDTALALLDLVLADGEDALERLHRAHPEIPVVVFFDATDCGTVAAALHAEAMGFIPKRASPEVLLAALRLVLAGQPYVPLEVLRLQSQRRSGGTLSGAPEAERARRAEEVGLTKRQLDVLGLLVQGKSNKAIARELGLSEGTVKTHAAAIFRALRVANRTEAGFAVNRLGIQVPFGRSPNGESRPAVGRTVAIAA